MKFHKEALQLNLSRHRNKIILGLSIAFFARSSKYFPSFSLSIFSPSNFVT